MNDDFGPYLAPARFVDSDHQLVKTWASRASHGLVRSEEVAAALFAQVRDIPYGAPDFDRPDSFRASDLLTVGVG